jgi:uncharacterized Fe-S cluster-containing radical SAM superfamily protein
MTHIDTEKFSATLRDKAINIANKSILVTNFQNSEQEKDFSEPSNCEGFGRIRHFKLGTGLGWPTNPLPILPALKALKQPKADFIRAQVFQNAVCNWRCWYCFVDFKLLSGNRKYSNYLSSDTLLNFFLNQENPPLMIDLTGGQPDLTPEWVLWMMQALIDKGLSNKIYLWSDDNLSNDYFWKYLTSEQIDFISSYPLYGRVCCFKGIDKDSFCLNTEAAPEYFENQFILFEKMYKTGIDLYSYITLPAKTNTNFSASINYFLDRIQKIDEFYPLRIVPLEVQKFSPVIKRITNLEEDLMQGQYLALKVWQEEIAKRFSKEMVGKDITEIKLKSR